MDFHFVQEFLTNIMSHLSADLFETFLRKVGEKAGEQVTSADLKHLRFKILGNLPLEDENLVLRAKAELDQEDPNLVIAHGKRLAGLKSHQQDYYRLTLVGYPDPKKDKDEDDRRRIDQIKTVIRLHAGMTDPQWKRELVEMNYNQKRAEKRFQQIMKFMRRNFPAAVKALYNAAQKLGADVYSALKTVLGDGWDKILKPAGIATGKGIAMGAKAAGKNIATGAKAVDGEVGRLADTLETPRRRIEDAANRINDQRRNRGCLARIFGI